MKNNTMFLKKCILIMGMLLALLGLAHGQTNGDYKAISGTPKVSSATGWQRYDGTNWVAATQSPFDYQQPFLNKISMGANAAGIEVDRDFILRGDFDGSTGNQLVTVKAGKTFEFGTNTGSNYALANLTVEAGARFINKGTMTSVDMTAKILLKAGSSMDGGGTLENQGVIHSDGFFEKEACSVLISGPNGKITGIVIFNVTDGSSFYIANQGGYSAAIQSTGTQNIDYPRLIYNGGPGQSSGDIPGSVYSVIVKNGTHLTLSESVVMVEKHKTAGMPDPTFKVEGGGTLDTGNYIITASKSNKDAKAQFVLDSGATIRTPNAQGISSVKGTGGNGNIILNGAIQTNFATYSSEANYIFSGTPGVRQNSGNFTTSPDQKTVNTIINESTTHMLKLDNTFRPLNVTTGYSGDINTDSLITTEGYVNGQTLPVTLSYFNAFFNGFDSVMLQWETQSETNNLGFYVLRSNEPDAALANVVSELVPAANSSQGASYYYEDAALYDDGLYYYWLQDVSFSGAVELHGPCMAYVTLQGGSSQAPDIPLKTGLIRNFPNPFNPSTQLEYYLEAGSDVSFEIYNLKGKLVDQFTLRNQGSGFHRYKWEPQLSSGTYLVKFTANGRTNTRKVVLTK